MIRRLTIASWIMPLTDAEIGGLILNRFRSISHQQLAGLQRFLAVCG